MESCRNQSRRKYNIRILHLWSFPEKNISGTVRQALFAVPFSSTAMGFFSKLQKMGLSSYRCRGGCILMREKETQITGLSESMKRSYWNETKPSHLSGAVKAAEIGHSLQALSLAYFFNQPFQTVPVTGVSNPSQLKRCAGCL